MWQASPIEVGILPGLLTPCQLDVPQVIQIGEDGICLELRIKADE